MKYLDLREKSIVTGNTTEELEDILKGMSEQTYRTRIVYPVDMKIYTAAYDENDNALIENDILTLQNVENGETIEYELPRDLRLAQEVAAGVFIKVRDEILPASFEAVEDLFRRAKGNCKMTVDHNIHALNAMVKCLRVTSIVLSSVEDGQIRIKKAKKIPDHYEIAFIARKNEYGEKRIFAAVSKMYTLYNETIILQLMEYFNEQKLGAEFESFEATHYITKAYYSLPNLTQDESNFYRLKNDVKFGLVVLNSSTADSALKGYATVSLGKSERLPITAQEDLLINFRKPHKGTEISAEKLGKNVLENIKKTYDKYISRISEIATADFDVNVRTALDLCLNQMKLRESSGSSICKAQQDKIADFMQEKIVIETMHPYDLLNIIFNMSTMIDSLGLSPAQIELIRNNTVRAVFTDFRKAEAE